ncbi:MULTISPECIES: GGDEF domain-containing protein [unclassified Chelatococcus]|uniref:GGDEF domain-containing protein n=1 Tax=unclassified Chelatococcus TaxID=2638111 RepID=UPI001BD02420|nr:MULTISPECIES: GGDEF domain-containing protein [unclassified Chelatococcus]MBS7697143.1 GGDEF domain-containing protein [Chelatococcus sp. YT9]MBX3559628.1 GGDEF domain-containing protein [Chelatococcus sp.]
MLFFRLKQQCSGELAGYAMSGVWFLSLLNPIIASAFASIFFVIWLHQRGRGYILYIFGAALFYVAGYIAHVFRFGESIGGNPPFPAMFYSASVILLFYGIFSRKKIRFGYFLMPGIIATMIALILYFYFVANSVYMRVYIINFGFGILFLVAAYRLRRAGNFGAADRILFWVLVASGIQFFPRTILALEVFDRGLLPRDFGRSIFWLWLNFSLVIVIVGIALAVLTAVVLDIIDDLKKDSSTDLMTGLLNRRGFEERAGAMLLGEEGSPVSMVYCDIDHFKAINDTHGHAAGDRVIQEFADLLATEMRAEDIAGRIGGEEFAILLPDADIEGARAFAERVRRNLEARRFETLAGRPRVTASFGIATRRAGEYLHELTRRADKMLYEAKGGGRNCVYPPGDNVLDFPSQAKA